MELVTLNEQAVVCAIRMAPRSSEVEKPQFIHAPIGMTCLS